VHVLRQRSTPNKSQNAGTVKKLSRRGLFFSQGFALFFTLVVTSFSCSLRPSYDLIFATSTAILIAFPVLSVFALILDESKIGGLVASLFMAGLAVCCIASALSHGSGTLFFAGLTALVAAGLVAWKRNYGLGAIVASPLVSLLIIGVVGL
jgi:hypothetical protein